MYVYASSKILNLSMVGVAIECWRGNCGNSLPVAGKFDP